MCNLAELLVPVLLQQPVASCPLSFTQISEDTTPSRGLKDNVHLVGGVEPGSSKWMVKIKRKP